MPGDMVRWLASLPLAEEQLSNGLVLTGQLLPVQAGALRIVVGEVCLWFSLDDVLDVAQLGPAEELGGRVSATATARVALRRGAPLLDARPSMLLEERSLRRPFALSVRSPTTVLDPAPRFREREGQFLLKHALISG
jgi:hypothetical protein